MDKPKISEGEARVPIFIIHQNEGKGQNLEVLTFHDLGWPDSGGCRSRISYPVKGLRNQNRRKERVERKGNKEGKSGVSQVPNRGQIRQRMKSVHYFSK